MPEPHGYGKDPEQASDFRNHSRNGQDCDRRMDGDQQRDKARGAVRRHVLRSHWILQRAEGGGGSLDLTQGAITFLKRDSNGREPLHYDYPLREVQRGRRPQVALPVHSGQNEDPDPGTEVD